MVKVAGRAVGQFGGEPDGRFGAEAEIAGGIGQLAHLACGGFDDAVVAIAGIDAPETGKAVYHLMARRIGDGRALGRFQHADAGLLMAAIGGDGVHKMSAVEFDKGIAQHDVSLQPRAWLARANV